MATPGGTPRAAHTVRDLTEEGKKRTVLLLVFAFGLAFLMSQRWVSYEDFIYLMQGSGRSRELCSDNAELAKEATDVFIWCLTQSPELVALLSNTVVPFCSLYTQKQSASSAADNHGGINPRLLLSPPPPPPTVLRRPEERHHRRSRHQHRRTVKVTFCRADPPAISHLCVHGPEFHPDDFTTEPLIVFSAKNLVLLRFAFTVGPRSTRRDSRLAEYFLYKAGHGKPSLTPIPYTPPDTVNSFYMCVLPLDGDDGGFVLADLCVTKVRTDYELHVFSSKTAKWTITPLRLHTSPGLRSEDLPGPYLNKVIALGGGVVGWVDLWRGVVSCNVFDKNPVLRLIPVPMFGCNEQREGDARPIRDMTCCNYWIKYVGLDVRYKEAVIHKRRSRPGNLNDVDIIYDSELLFHDDGDDVFTANQVELTCACDGWKLRTWYRRTSWDYWRKGQTVDIDDISADSPGHSMLRPLLWDAEAGRFTLRKLHSLYPTVGIHGGDDVVYMMSKLECHDKNASMIGVDLGKKTVNAVVPVCCERACYFSVDFHPSELSKYFNAANSKANFFDYVCTLFPRTYLHNNTKLSNSFGRFPSSPSDIFVFPLSASGHVLMKSYHLSSLHCSKQPGMLIINLDTFLFYTAKLNYVYE
ncbi:hypothetical protein ZWY2020_007101 [Hordeum vulgare]|nr:hypothetical protein ZWY2020_007101 [Hordeum vulgare]